YLRETGLEIARLHPVVLVTWDDEREDPAVLGMERLAGTPSEALATTPGPLAWPRGCEGASNRPAHPLWSISALDGRRRPGRDRAAIFLGLPRRRALLDRLRARYRLEPIEEREVEAAPATPSVDTQCPVDLVHVSGDALPDCRLRLGWYRLV